MGRCRGVVYATANDGYPGGAVVRHRRGPVFPSVVSVFAASPRPWLLVFQRKEDVMQNERKCLARCLAVAVLASASVAGSALAQSAVDQVPDRAALIGVPVTADDAINARSRTMTPQDTQRRATRAGVQRTAADRRASLGLNRELAKLPETREQALNQAKRGPRGSTITSMSMQDIEPMFAVPTADGGINASHGTPDDNAR
jgi:hypothetical protein